MRSIGDVERPGREVAIDVHADGTATVIVRTPTKTAATLVDRAALIAALNRQE